MSSKSRNKFIQYIVSTIHQLIRYFSCRFSKLPEASEQLSWETPEYFYECEKSTRHDKLLCASTNHKEKPLQMSTL